MSGRVIRFPEAGRRRSPPPPLPAFAPEMPDDPPDAPLDSPASDARETSVLTLADGFPPADDAAWRALVERGLKGADFERTLASRTADGIRVAPLYTRADWPHAHDAVGAALPDAPAWDIRQAHGHPDPAVANAQLLEDLEGGATSIVLGADPLGARGTIMRSPDDLTAALDGVLLELAPVHLAPVGPWAAIGEAYRAWLAARTRDAGTSATAQRGGLGADPLGLLALDGTLDTSLEGAMTALGTLAVRTHESLPSVRSVSVSSLPYHGAWASEAQELACAVATGVAYLRAMTAAGLGATDAAAQIEFTLAADVDQFATIAKFRAMRRLWARVLEACGVDASREPAPLTATTAPRMLTRYDPYVNMLRATIATFAAGVGGADAQIVLPFDVALGTPGARGRRLARNTHHVLLAEAGVRRVSDPAGGAWLYERLTDELARAAWQQFQAIERAGGMASSLASGHVAREIAAVRAATAKRLATRRDAITGVSEFPHLDEVLPEPEVVDVAALLAARPALTFTAPSEASASARVEALPQARFGAMFERFREASDALAARGDGRPRAFLATIGSLAEYSARAGFARNLCAAGGLATTTGDGGTEVAAIVSSFAASGARVAVVCGTDAAYAEHAEALIRALRDAGARWIVLAGRPGTLEEALRAAGLDDAMYLGADAPALLARCWQAAVPGTDVSGDAATEVAS